MQKKQTIPQLLSLNIYWIGLSFMWNSLHPIVLPAVLIHLVPENAKNTYLGLLTFTGLILAMFIQPISGALSDSWHSKMGKRRPLIIIGTAFDFVFLSFLAWSGGFLWVVLGYIGLQVSSNIAHGPLQALLPDRVPDEQIGIASGFKNLMDMGGLIIASLAAGNLLSPQERSPFRIMVVVMVVLAFTALVTILTTREKPSNTLKKDNFKLRIKDIFQIDMKVNAAYVRLIIARFVFLLGVYGIQAFAQYYIRDAMQVQNPIEATGNIMAALAVALVLCSVAGGWMIDKLGARKVLILAGALTAAGCVLLPLAHDLNMLTTFAGIVGAGIGFFLTSNWAVANRLAPTEEAGKFLGLTNLATAGASATGRLGGPLIDLFNNLFPEKYFGYYGLFLFGAVCALVSIILHGRVFKIQKNNPDLGI